MNVKQIRVFTTVYEEKSVTRAARKLGMTQPSVSLALRELEGQYNTKLFERDGRGIRPTDAADHFYPDAAHFLTIFRELDESMSNWNQEGTIKIGASISVGSCILPALVKRLQQDYPELRIQVTVNSSDIIEEKILENKLDLALIEGNIHSEKIHSERFLDDEILPICSRFHRFAGRDDVTIEELANEKFLMRESTSGTRQQAEAALHTKGLQIQPVWESTSTAALANAVQEDLGISFLPKRMLEDKLRTSRVVPFGIKGVRLERKYHLIYHENKFVSEPMQDLIELARQLRDHEK